MITALVRAIGQLSDPRARRIVVLSVLGAAGLFVALAALVWVLLFRTALVGWGWADTIIDVLGGLAVFALAYLFFPTVVVTISSFLLDDVANAVEARYYPSMPPAREQSVGEMIGNAVRFFLVLAGLNLLALPIYLFLPAINLAVFYILNGYLLSREYYELVAFRRLDRLRARQLRRAHSLKLFSAGVIIAFFSTIPLVNLVVPVVAAAFMVHIFYGLNGSERPSTA